MAKIRKRLKDLKKQNQLVTLLIKSGGNCCRISGCLIDLKTDYVTLVRKDSTCNKIYIRIDCICAIIELPKEPIPPVPPPPDEECECQVTGAGTTAGLPCNRARLSVVACPGCTLGPSQVLYENKLLSQDIELILLPSGAGEITSVSCEDGQAATIRGRARVIIAGEEQAELCEFILEVTDTMPPTADTIRMRIICEGEEVHDSGVLDLLGQSINIREC